MSLYPLKFNTIYKEKLWGGQKIKSILGKDFGDLDNCGETWELSGVAGNVSAVENGKDAGKRLDEYLHEQKASLVGEAIYARFQDEFPLLIKFIDADQDLSIQVHPDDAMAMKRHGGQGKTEMWYILQADKGAQLINGFAKDTHPAEYLSHLERGTLTDLLHYEKVDAGDVFYLPAGRVHTIGRGLLLAEIQQTSDLTYRIYDFDRVDKNGKKRELHTELAVEAIDYKHPGDVKSSYDTTPNEINNIIESPFFTTNKIHATKKLRLDRSHLDSFKIYIGVGGSGRIAGEPLRFGEVMLVPAAIKSYDLEPAGHLEVLESYIQPF